MTTHTPDEQGQDYQCQDRVFLADFQTMSEFGATPRGGVDRQAASDADNAQRRWMHRLLEEHGLRVVYDRVGNQFGLLDLVEGAPYVVIGSHMDSQPTAGRYDGAYGVLCAAHAAFRLKDRLEWEAQTGAGHDGSGRDCPVYNLAVVNWFNEEGSRFVPSMMGSSVYTGVMPLRTALETRDPQGISVAEALAPTGFLGDDDGPRAVYCAEIHIEQGRILENAGRTIGFVSATWAASKYRVVFRGEQAHSGATVMEDRKDALYAAARLTVFARELADRFPGTLHTAIGKLDVYPNSPVVVASEVSLLLDLRTPDEQVLEDANRILAEQLGVIEKETGVSIESTMSHSWGIDPYQPEGVELAREVAADLGHSGQEIYTVAGHDSVNMKRIVPTVMLFVPSVEGISHNEHELTSEPDMIAGLEVFTEVVRRLLHGALDTSAPA